MTAILLTGVGKRYDIVSAFAQHATVVAADPNPLAPGAVRGAPPRRGAAHQGPRRTSRRCARCATSTASARSSRSPTSTSRRSRRRAPTGTCPRRSCPAPETATATYDKYEAHLTLERLGLPSPPTVLPGERGRRAIPVMVKPRRGSGADVDPPRRTTPTRPRSSRATCATRTRWCSGSWTARSSRSTA